MCFMSRVGYFFMMEIIRVVTTRVGWRGGATRTIAPGATKLRVANVHDKKGIT